MSCFPVFIKLSHYYFLFDPFSISNLDHGHLCSIDQVFIFYLTILLQLFVNNCLDPFPVYHQAKLIFTTGQSDLTAKKYYNGTYFVLNLDLICFVPPLFLNSKISSSSFIASLQLLLLLRLYLKIGHDLVCAHKRLDVVKWKNQNEQRRENKGGKGGFGGRQIGKW